MPDVLTLEGRPKPCKWLLAIGPQGKRQFAGCFDTKSAAKKMANKLNAGRYRSGRGGASHMWRPVRGRPPGVPMQGLHGQIKKHVDYASDYLYSAQRSLDRFRPGECELLFVAAERLGRVNGNLEWARKNKRAQKMNKEAVAAGKKLIQLMDHCLGRRGRSRRSSRPRFARGSKPW